MLFKLIQNVIVQNCTIVQNWHVHINKNYLPVDSFACDN